MDEFDCFDCGGGIASLMASVCAEESCERDMTLYAQRAKAWFGFSREEAESILQEAGSGFRCGSRAVLSEIVPSGTQRGKIGFETIVPGSLTPRELCLTLAVPKASHWSG